MKMCPACKVEMPLSEFGKSRSRKDGRNTYCKLCARARQKVAQAEFRARNPGYSAQWMAEKRASSEYLDQQRERERIRYQANLETERKRNREWRRNNPQSRDKFLMGRPGYMADVKARYRAAMLMAMPDWADKAEIKKVYADAKRRSAKDEIQYQVDHIVPLQGENVCGLHVHWNLQILSAFDNRSKGNRVIEALAIDTRNI